MKRKSNIQLSTLVASAILIAFIARVAQADVVEFTLQGSAGGGVTAANEPGDTGNGSGDLRTNAIYDTDTNMFSLDVGWGSGNGFADLTSAASLVNLHFVEDGVPPDVFEQSGSAFLTFDEVDESPLSGGVTNTVEILEEREADLLAGRVYLHIHTDDISGGEARGYFISQAVPEPGSASILGLAAIGLFVRRRRDH